MIAKLSRRDLLQAGALTAGTLGLSAITDSIDAATESSRSEQTPRANALTPGKSADSPVELYYREDWFGSPWETPETVLFIHGNDESGIIWYGWIPRMGKEFRLLRPDLPGLGRSPIPPAFQWSIPSIAAMLAQFLDSVGVESAHVIAAKSGGSIAMQFAVDYPKRTRTLTLASAPVTPVSSRIAFSAPSSSSQQRRLGSAAPKEQIEFFNQMMGSTSPEAKAGMAKVEEEVKMEAILPRISAPTLVITADRSALQSVETVMNYQKKIPNSRLLVLPADGYHVAVIRPEECVTSVLSFIKETRQSRQAIG